MVVLYSLSGLVRSSHSSSNLALGRPYWVSPLPNYTHSAPPSDRTSLTDGRYTVGYFWTQKTTVGWHGSKLVEIMIDLEKPFIMGGIVFSTARYTGVGVNYPAHIAAFVGPDQEHLQYIGDLASDPDNLPGPYTTKRFVLDGIGVMGRYVLLEIVAGKGSNIFCDEVEVLPGIHDSGGAGSLTVEQARNYTEELRRLDIEKEILTNLADKFKSDFHLDTTTPPTDYERELVKL